MEMHFWSIFGRLLGGAGGRGGVCGSLQSLQILHQIFSHALLPLRGCGELKGLRPCRRPHIIYGKIRETSDFWIFGSVGQFLIKIWCPGGPGGI